MSCDIGATKKLSKATTIANINALANSFALLDIGLVGPDQSQQEIYVLGNNIVVARRTSLLRQLKSLNDNYILVLKFRQQGERLRLRY